VIATNGTYPWLFVTQILRKVIKVMMAAVKIHPPK
jgi:hypothetical protein